MMVALFVMCTKYRTLQTNIESRKNKNVEELNKYFLILYFFFKILWHACDSDLHNYTVNLELKMCGPCCVHITSLSCPSCDYGIHLHSSRDIQIHFLPKGSFNFPEVCITLFQLLTVYSQQEEEIKGNVRGIVGKAEE